ncbi:hypothetical protein [Pseudoneobacillus rhizosphaerae]|uniref:Uncharacterized protein n=1 Tax=Pseudoneobacillus rhizosphaerae TaxID=2880968 RepID=A0A9C7G945_9BACI|nr:hypothetical protein [Pseudoneobacillus rhizosphaerae]CAG9607745.1 hypothetical protein NEOCIP111885_01437 [Pseudoneobacillus rhizosphaerae]
MFETDLSLVGKHATYTKFLVNDAKIFKRYIDVFMNGAIFGFLYGRKSEKDKDSTDRANILAGAFITEKMRCDFIYRLIMLLDDSPGITNENKIDRAFRDDSKGEKSENHIANMNLFNSYVLGGIEVLFEKFTEDCTTKEDYINKIYEVVSNFKDEIEGVEYNDRIKEVIQVYSN